MGYQTVRELGVLSDVIWYPVWGVLIARQSHSVWKEVWHMMMLILLDSYKNKCKVEVLRMRQIYSNVVIL